MPLSSLFFDVDGPLHVADHGGPEGAPVLLCVHGLGSSHAGWAALAAELVGTHRVLAVDLPGWGRSPAAGRRAAVRDAGAVLARLVEQLGTGPVTLVGHSMGAAVTVLATAQAGGSVERVVLLAPPMPRDGLRFISPSILPHVALCLWPRLGHLALRRRVARRGIESHVRDGLRLTCGTSTAATELEPALVSEFAAALSAGEDPLLSFIEAARSVGMLVANGQHYREALAAIDVPVDVVHGAEDRVLDPAGLRQLEALQPGWRTHLLPGVGHSPHMEVPATTAALLTGSPLPAPTPPVRDVVEQPTAPAWAWGPDDAGLPA